MAGREKKPAIVKKQNISATLSKDSDVQLDAPTEKTTPVKSNVPKLEAVTQTASSPAVKQLIKSKKPTQTKTIKKNLKIKFKAKNKNAKKLKLSKSLFKTNKHLDAKNITIVKNGIKNRGKKKAQTKTTETGNNEKEMSPPVLEPMTNLPEGNVTPKKEPKKRTKKQTLEENSDVPSVPLDTKKIKIEVDEKETVEDVLNDVANELQLDIETLMKKPGRKAKVAKKTPVVKQKKAPTPKKTKGEGVKGKKAQDKESLMANLSKDYDLDSTSAQNVINKLDLNVTKTVKKEVGKKRRHSIEKFLPVEENSDSPNFEQPFAIFTNLRRSASPRSKRNTKLRQSIDNSTTKRYSPYSTRSDSPARILRNGKHRKLKGAQLLDGLENEYKRRRRFCSEHSMNDLAKFSEYLSESDSNFSMTSCAENGASDTTDSPKEEGVMTKSDLLRKEILDSIKPSVTDVRELQNLNIKQISTKFTAILKRSLSTETSQLMQDANVEDIKPKPEELSTSSFTDTNSNDVKPQIKIDVKSVAIATSTPNEKESKVDSVKIKKEEIDEQVIDKIASSPSYKVPEKSFILDQMKQIFNDSVDDPERRTTRSSVKRSLKLSTSDENETIPASKSSESDTSKETVEINETVASDTTEEMTDKSAEETEIEPEVEKSIQEEIEEVMEQLVLPESVPEQHEPIEVPVEDELAEEKIDINENECETNEETVEEPKETVEEVAEPTELAMEVEQLKVVPESEPEQEKVVEEIEVEEKEKLIQEDLITKLSKNSAISFSIKETKIEMSKETKEEEKIPEPVEEEVKEPEVEIPEPIEEMVTEEIEEKVLEIQEKEVVEETVPEEAQQEEIKEPETMEIIPEKTAEPTTEEEKEETKPDNPVIVETPEQIAIKESILRSLGLQSLRAAEEAKLREKQKPVNKNDVYTGTLKTVIKLNRSVDKKKGRNPLKMTLQKSKGRNSKDGDCDNTKSDGASKNDGENACYKVMKESGSSSGWRHGSHSSDTAGANRKSHYSNRSNPDGSSEQTSDNDAPAAEGEGTADTKTLVIPEKASSFSIHPGRLCSDECAYCFGKFGLFDTPLHIAQIKSVERQDKILENEVYLMRDSCLCDACYRHVDRRNTSGSAVNTKTYKRNSTSSTVPRPNYCHVLGCGQESTNVLRRKWLMKVKRTVSRLINIDLDNPGLHSIPVCAEHYQAVEHLMVCALCKRRLARNHIHYLGSEYEPLNSALQKEGIPVTLTDKPVVCKLCRYFASLLLKPPPSDSQSNTAEFFRQYKKRLLHFHDIEVMDEGEADEPISVPVKDKNEKESLKKKSKNKPSKSKLNNSSGTSNGSQPSETDKPDQTRVPLNSENGESRASTPSDTIVDYETLVPNLSLECSDVDEIRNEVPQKLYRKIQLPESVREAVEISKIMKVKKDNLVERLGSNPSISVRQLFQGEEDLPLQGNIDFNAVKERTPEGWEKCVCTIQYDTDTKHLWQELQKPYGNQSSFLRHLILLEKYFRNGDLTLSPNASHHAVNYSVSVQNRLRAYDNIPSGSEPMQPLTMIPFNQVKKSQSGIITTKDVPSNITAVINAANLPKNTPISISQLNPNILTQLSVRQKTSSVPPGLISLQPGTNRPVASLKGTQKIKVPVNKNWKPTLIPVTSTSATSSADRRLSGLVQVISGGKPYHISLSDYNKMCYLKRNQEMKKMSDGKGKSEGSSPSSLLKPVIPRKQKAVTITATKTSKEKSSSAVEIIKETNGSPQEKSKQVMILPKIPKSLTVIPQTVTRKPPQPSSPTLSITTKPSTSKS